MRSSILRPLVLSLVLASPLTAFANNHPAASSPPAQHTAAQKQAKHGKNSKDKAHGQAHSNAASSKK